MQTLTKPETSIQAYMSRGLQKNELLHNSPKFKHRFAARFDTKLQYGHLTRLTNMGTTVTLQCYTMAII